MSCEFIGFCALNPSEQAAWVQAVFSVIAILVAIAVPYVSEKRRLENEKNENLKKARGYALEVHEGALSLMSCVITSILRSKDEFAEESLNEINEAIVIPASLMEKASVLYQLGEAGIFLQDAIMLVGRAKSEIDNEDIRLRYAGSEHDEDGELERLDPINFIATLEHAKEKLDLALQEIKKLFPRTSSPSG